MIRRYISILLFILISAYIIKVIAEMFLGSDKQTDQAKDIATDTDEPPEDGDRYWEVDASEEIIDDENNNTFGEIADETQMVTVYIADSVAQSRLIQMHLDEKDIPSSVQETGMSMLPFAGDSIDPVSILVPSEHAEAAKEFIREFLASAEKKTPDDIDRSSETSSQD